ncbi:hypothetical protein E2C01_078390 [Portunus trituberculatus]|uniref:Uncharacterized protein n=1 Tax=Portunus trituberculatus TaxID=210409 RepID=A0A5B7IMT3_PORTR|nr:hypothetical protein [Portunus trituberculatus]
MNRGMAGCVKAANHSSPHQITLHSYTFRHSSPLTTLADSQKNEASLEQRGMQAGVAACQGRDQYIGARRVTSGRHNWKISRCSLLRECENV